MSNSNRIKKYKKQDYYCIHTTGIHCVFFRYSFTLHQAAGTPKFPGFVSETQEQAYK